MGLVTLTLFLSDHSIMIIMIAIYCIVSRQKIKISQSSLWKLMIKNFMVTAVNCCISRKKISQK